MSSGTGPAGKQSGRRCLGERADWRERSLAGNYCALLENGGVECWGSNHNDGALGNGSKEAFSDVALPVKGIAGATSLVYDPAGGGGYCALLGTSGRVECWGDNRDGELGDGGREPNSPVPVRVTGLGS